MSYISDLLRICSETGCECKTDVSLSKYTTFKVGGLCRAMVFIKSVRSLLSILNFLKKGNIAYYILGKGSNVIASDNGYNGVILLMGTDFSDVRLVNETDIFCEAGTSLADICTFALKNELTGLEFAYGIPGTAGGALYMNAGAYGGEMKDIVVSAHYVDESLEIKKIDAADMNLAYRSSIFAENPDYIITDMVLRLRKGESGAIRSKMKELIGKRKEKQPLNFPSAGSTFKRPEGNYASLLIEQCGLKGVSVGGAEVSTKHSGFIINKGGASAGDIIELAGKVRSHVERETGYILELEPKILGDI
ncbi:MAG: UDP-N-acetylmuramate dehydrogenase [Porcipelethomonas sp.]